MPVFRRTVAGAILGGLVGLGWPLVREAVLGETGPLFYAPKTEVGWAAYYVGLAVPTAFIGAAVGFFSGRRKYADRHKSAKFADQFQPPDDEEEKPDPLPYMVVKEKARYAAAIAYGARNLSATEELRQGVWARYLHARDTVFRELENVTDEFFRSAAMHAVSDMLIVAGEDDEARQLIPRIEVQFIREEAEKDFVIGPKSVFAKWDRPNSASYPNVRSEPRDSGPVASESGRSSDASGMLARLGYVIYWIGYILAALFIGGGVVWSWQSTSGGDIMIIWALCAGAALFSWLIGRALKYVFAGE